MPGAHSVILGGSNAARLLACPGSHQEQMKTPYNETSSVYAQEGTALHAAIAKCYSLSIDPAELLGELIETVEITEEHVAVLKKALATLETLRGPYGKFKLAGIEETLPLPGVTGAFGSVDLVLTNGDTVAIVDWKFGQGVPVKALYDMGDYDQVNPQLAFYAAAARGKRPRLFKGKTILLVIIQPRLDPPIDYVEVENQELDDFLSAFHGAFLEAIGRNPRKERGEHCRFAACKATCELWTGPVLDLALFDPVAAALQASATEKPTDYGAFLSKALAVVELYDSWAAEIRKQGHVYLESGGQVPDWKLVPKRATRQWRDEGTVEAELRAIGASQEDIYTEPEIRSVAQMEKALKKRRIAIPPALWHAVSTGTTIAHVDDGRPEVSRETLADDVKQALLAL